MHPVSLKVAEAFDDGVLAEIESRFSARRGGPNRLLFEPWLPAFVSSTILASQHHSGACQSYYLHQWFNIGYKI